MLPSFFPSLLPSVIACVRVRPSFVHSSVLPSICPSTRACVHPSFHPSVHPFFLPSFLSSFLPFHSSKLTKNLQSLYKRIGLRKFHCCFICGAESLNMIFDLQSAQFKKRIFLGETRKEQTRNWQREKGEISRRNFSAFRGEISRRFAAKMVIMTWVLKMYSPRFAAKLKP